MMECIWLCCVYVSTEDLLNLSRQEALRNANAHDTFMHTDIWLVMKMDA